MSATAQQLRERVTFKIGEPFELSLERDGNPTEDQDRNGNTEYRYFLASHQIMWVPEQVHQAIERAEAGPDGWFAITKHKAPKPWSVVHLETTGATEYGYGTASPTNTPPPSRPVRETTDDRAARGLEQTPRPTPPAAVPATPRPPAAAPAGSSNYYAALCAAIRVATQAEKFASEIGRPLAFQTADIRAMAATLYIAEGK